MPSFTHRQLTAAEVVFCESSISADAFAAIVIDRLVTHRGLTCVRASDGERALVSHYLHGADLAPFLKDPEWTARYGIAGADMYAMGREILEAGNDASYLAPTISGLWYSQFKTVDLFKPRYKYVDIFYPYHWGRNQECKLGVLNAAPRILLAHHNCEKIIADMTASKGEALTSQLIGFPLKSWTEHDQVLDLIERAHPDLVLVCGGPHGKVLVGKIGKMGRPIVALDVGSAIENAW